MMPANRLKPRLQNEGSRGSSRAASVSSTFQRAPPRSIGGSSRPSPEIQTFRTPQPRSREPSMPPDTPSQEHCPDSDLDDDTLNEVVMAVDMGTKGTVGCSYYVARDETLYFMEDVRLGDVTIVDALRVYIDPTVVLVSTRIDDTVIEILESLAEDRFSLPFLLEVRPPGEFAFETAKGKLATLRFDNSHVSQVNFVVPGDPGSLGEESLEDTSGQQNRLLYIGGLIDLESRLTIGCAGALLSYLQRRRAAAYLPGDQASLNMFHVSTLQMFNLHDTMFINQDTLRSLQIMENESHPNTHNQGPTKTSSGSKEGLSVFGLFLHLARTSQGKHLLRQCFLRPSMNLHTINGRLNTIETFLKPENVASFEAMIKSLKSIGNMRTTMIGLRKGTTTGSKKNGYSTSSNLWTSIRRFAFHALKIKEIFPEIIGSECLDIRTKFFEHVEGYHLAQVGRKISDTVDLEKSAEECRTVILEGFDAELDNMKRTFVGLDDLLGTVARSLSENLPATFQATLNVLYFPQIGFLITVPLDSESDEPVYPEDSWEHMFSTEDQAYFKNSQMREMDGHFGDLYGIITDREIEISHELAQYVLQYEELLTRASDVCGELDSILALAQAARLYKLCRPKVSEDNVIRIVGGRHILQERNVGSFVPNDTFLVGGPDRGQECEMHLPGGNQTTGPSALILTGPNYSGKSVYLKQVALIVYMAQIGSYVPAETAQIGLTDRVLSRVTTRETVSRMQSAFMIDLQQISQALSLATSRSLLIIDEFGKGTDSSDGAGLACAVFNHLVSMGNARPKVIAATHFHEIFENRLLEESPLIALGHMQVKIDDSTPEQDSQVAYLYNLCEGRSNSSFGTSCAAINGVPKEIVQRADDLISMALQGEDLIAACSIMPRTEVQELEEAEHIARRFLEVDVFANPKEILQNILSIFGTT